MAIALPRSTFFHVGRTGGHWVAHVLWKAGLVQQELRPLHLTPTQVMSRFPEAIRPFSFCFVRHPLRWLSSMWRHEMEFGWSNTHLSESCRSEDFTEFVERMLEACPGGPCWSQMHPFVDGCNFVGATERISEDLGKALGAAGEEFDPALLASPPVNESSVARLKPAARAPRALLEKVMRAERSHFARFGYGDVPEELVAERPNQPIWPILPLKNGADTEALKQAQQSGLMHLNFDYRFENGQSLEGNIAHRRTQWALLEALEGVSREGRCLVMHESDPYFAYAARTTGFKDRSPVDALAPSRRAQPQNCDPGPGDNANLL